MVGDVVGLFEIKVCMECVVVVILFEIVKLELCWVVIFGILVDGDWI